MVGTWIPTIRCTEADMRGMSPVAFVLEAVRKEVEASRTARERAHGGVSCTN